jgi:hypothetical protein
MNQKPFLRESNIWRLIGLAILIGAGILALFAPPIEAFKIDEQRAITVPGIIALVGGILMLFPLIKEAFIMWKAPDKIEVNSEEVK